MLMPQTQAALKTELMKALAEEGQQQLTTYCPTVLHANALQAALKTELMKALVEEAQRSVVHKVCDTVSELAADCLDKGAWPEVLPALQVRRVGAVCLLQSCMEQCAADCLDKGAWPEVLPALQVRWE
jgi:hypothetical protein